MVRNYHHGKGHGEARHKHPKWHMEHPIFTDGRWMRRIEHIPTIEARMRLSGLWGLREQQQEALHGSHVLVDGEVDVGDPKE
mgnify:CR=1 FL=1